MSGRESNYASRLAKAEHDLLNIQNNLSAEQIPWDTVCFHAQQAAEKCLKAFLIYHGRPFSRTHDLVALSRRALRLSQRWVDCKMTVGVSTTTGLPLATPMTFMTRMNAMEWKCLRLPSGSGRASPPAFPSDIRVFRPSCHCLPQAIH